jgi:hypothetical protein
MRFEIRLGRFWVSASSRHRRGTPATQRFHGTTLAESAREHSRPCNHLTGADSSDQNDRELARTTAIVLAEFAGLRSEIVTRTSGLVF